MTDSDEPMDLEAAERGLAAVNEKMRLVREAHEAKQAGDAPDVEATFAALTEGFSVDADGPTWMLTLLREAGPVGLTVDELVDRLKDKGVGRDRATVYRWLRSSQCGQVPGRVGYWTAPGVDPHP